MVLQQYAQFNDLGREVSFGRDLVCCADPDLGGSFWAFQGGAQSAPVLFLT